MTAGEMIIKLVAIIFTFYFYKEKMNYILMYYHKF